MKCNNTHCKHYVSAEKYILFGWICLTDGGCKYAFCKKNKRTGKRR